MASSSSCDFLRPIIHSPLIQLSVMYLRVAQEMPEYCSDLYERLFGKDLGLVVQN